MTQSALQEVLAQEQHLQLLHFNNQTAWQLGCALKQAVEDLAAAVSIEVYAFEQVLFSYAMPGTSKDNLEWIRRKRQAVMRFGHSSYYLGLYNAAQQRDFEAQAHIDAREYCAHGGSFPLRLQGCGQIGAVTVSGLPQESDHNLVVAALTQILAEQQG
ncbi:heme-degrading domain-containing protein [Agarivorans gilvus]|uniref:UPF0303 protein GCM10007414_37880 n=1 Tax=Agarivorans gilvus TaxID=680279 RepID=A0ABQ1I6A5_9ALTE|nr:heme-degrading domain-containing protein [Agarivorans gilvus]GGB20902.1 UPF0303 protein [Agarivorans gilvus]